MFEKELFDAVKRNDADTVRRLISGELTGGQFMNVNVGFEGYTPLTYAVKMGYSNIVQQLVACGADITLKDSYNQAPIEYTFEGRNDEVTILLLSKLKSLDLFTFEDYLFSAIERGDTNTVQNLISGKLINGQYLNVNESRGGFTALDYAILLDHHSIVEQLLKCDGKQNKPALRKIDINEFRKKFEELLHAGLKDEQFGRVRQHENQTLELLDQAFKEAVEESVDYDRIRTFFFEKLEGLAKVNDGWRAQGFSPATKPSHHIAREVSNLAREIFKAILNEGVDAQVTAKMKGAKGKGELGLLLFERARKATKTRSEVYQETRDAVKNGYRLKEGTAILLDSKEMQEKTELVENPPVLEEIARPVTKMEVRVINGDAVDVGQYLLAEGFNPVVLNMAHARHPGGSAAAARAQEESIYRRTNYFEALELEENPVLKKQMDARNARAGGANPTRYKIPVIGGIYTPHVSVIRKSEAQADELIKPFTLSMIAASAHNPFEKASKLKATDDAYRDGMEQKIRAILRITARKGHDAVVLGAFGCGAFKMNERTPSIVASIFEKVLKDKEFVGLFKYVAFAILDRPEGELVTTFSKRLNFDMGFSKKVAKPK